MPVTSGPTCRPTSGRRCCGRGTGCPTGPAPSCSRSRSAERSAVGRSLARAADLAGTTADEASGLLREAVDERRPRPSPRTAGTGSTTRCRPRPSRVDSRARNVDGCTRRSPGPAPPTSTTRRYPRRPSGSPPPPRSRSTTRGPGTTSRRTAGRCARPTSPDRLDDRAGLLGLLGRLVDLRDRVEVAADSPVELLERLRHVAAGSGDQRDRARRRRVPARPARRGEGPLLVCARCSCAGNICGSRPAVASSGDPGGGDAAAAALERAQAIGHPRALAYACAAGAMALAFARRPAGRSSQPPESRRRSRRPAGGPSSTPPCGRSNGTAAWGTAEWAHVARRRRRQLEALGAPHPYLAWLSSDEGAGPCSAPATGAGVPSACASPSGSDPGAAGDVTARLTAARLAVLQGRQREAEDHLARADELFAETTRFLAFEFDAVRAEVRLGAGDAEGAHEAAMAGALSPGVPPTLCEWLCPLAARALADLAETIPRGGPPGRAGPGATRRPRRPVPPRHRGQHVRLAGVRGAAGRAGRAATPRRSPAPVAPRTRPPAGRAPRTSSTASGPGMPPTPRTAPGRRCSSAGVVHATRPRTLLSGAPRSWPRSCGPSPSCGRSSSWRSRRASPSTRCGRRRPGLATRGCPGCTAREREVLQHVVAGRTYGEIARALFVSEKTVSSHVSNLLRKTGASNRVELARLARHATASPPR